MVFIGFLALVGYGGWALYRDHVAKPDDGCFWLVFEAGGPYEGKWLLDTPPPEGCVRRAFVQSHFVKWSRDVDELAAFNQKAGRKICGQSTTLCDAPDGGR